MSEQTRALRAQRQAEVEAEMEEKEKELEFYEGKVEEVQNAISALCESIPAELEEDFEWRLGQMKPQAAEWIRLRKELCDLLKPFPATLGASRAKEI